MLPHTSYSLVAHINIDTHRRPPAPLFSFLAVLVPLIVFVPVCMFSALVPRLRRPVSRMAPVKLRLCVFCIFQEIREQYGVSRIYDAMLSRMSLTQAGEHGAFNGTVLWDWWTCSDCSLCCYLPITPPARHTTQTRCLTSVRMCSMIYRHGLWPDKAGQNSDCEMCWYYIMHSIFCHFIFCGCCPCAVPCSVFRPMTLLLQQWESDTSHTWYYCMFKIIKSLWRGKIE